MILATTMLLKKLIKDKASYFPFRKIKGISFDSRKTKRGDIFVAIKGSKFNGDNFIKEALSKGASYIVHSNSLKKKYKANYLQVRDTRETLAYLCSKLYQKKPKNLIAVTGTNGKTSVSDFFYQIFKNQKKKAGYIGTGNCN